MQRDDPKGVLAMVHDRYYQVVHGLLKYDRFVYLSEIGVDQLRFCYKLSREGLFRIYNSRVPSYDGEDGGRMVHAIVRDTSVDHAALLKQIMRDLGAVRSAQLSSLLVARGIVRV